MKCWLKEHSFQLAVVTLGILLCVRVVADHYGINGPLSARTNIQEEPSNWTKLVEEIVAKEMSECNLFIMFKDESEIAQLLPHLTKHLKGFTLVDLRQINQGYLLMMKRRLLEYDSTICLNFIVMYSGKVSNSLLQEGVQFWHGRNKILFVVMPNSGEVAVRSEFLLHQCFRFSSQVVLAEKDKGSSIWNIYSLRQFVGPYRQKLYRVNLWSPMQGFRNVDTKLFSEKDTNFQNYRFSVVALPYPPFVIEKDLTTWTPGRYRGMEVDLLNAISKIANFSYNFVSPEDKQWGEKVKDNWTGMIGMVNREEANWAISDISFSEARMDIVDFTDTVIYDAMELVTPRAKPLPKWLGPIRPFSGFVWITIGIYTIAMTYIMNGIARVISHYKNKRNYFSSCGNCTLYSLQILLMKGAQGDIKEYSGRIFLSVWLLSSMIIGTFYTSSITSFLVLPGYYDPINSFEELIASDTGWAKVDYGGFQRAYLESSTDPVLMALNHGVQWRTSLNETLNDVVKGKFATWENAITTRMKVAVQFTDRTGKPLVHFTRAALLFDRIAWPLQKFATYKERLNQVISRIMESGLLEKFYTDILFEEQILSLQKKKKCDEQVSEEVVTSSENEIILNLNHFQGPFSLLIIGYLLGFLSLLMENIISCLKKS